MILLSKKSVGIGISPYIKYSIIIVESYTGDNDFSNKKDSIISDFRLILYVSSIYF